MESNKKLNILKKYQDIIAQEIKDLCDKAIKTVTTIVEHKISDENKNGSEGLYFYTFLIDINRHLICYDKVLKYDERIEKRKKILNFICSGKKNISSNESLSSGLLKSYDKAVLSFYVQYSLYLMESCQSKDLQDFLVDQKKELKSPFEFHNLAEARESALKISKEAYERAEKDISLYDIEDHVLEIANPLIEVLKANCLIWEKEIKEIPQKIIEDNIKKQEIEKKESKMKILDFAKQMEAFRKDNEKQQQVFLLNLKNLKI